MKKIIERILDRIQRAFRPEIRVFVDMDGTLAEWNFVEEEDLYKQGYFLNLRPNDGMIAVVEDMCKDRIIDHVHVLSWYLDDSPYAYAEKLQWIIGYLPSNIEPILVPYGTSKVEAVNKVTGRNVGKGDILIDDYSPNCIEWEENKGAVALKFLNEINGSGQSRWSGKRSCAANLRDDIDDIIFGR